MSAIRGVKDRRFKFVQLLNSMFEDKNLSLRAKGFIGYCLTKPEEWVFHIKHLVSNLKEGEDAIYSTIAECESQGYAFRYQTRNKDGTVGKFETVVSDSKEEIALIKEEFDQNPDFNKFLPHRAFPDAVVPDAVVPPHSNNIKEEILEKQQQQQEKHENAAAAFEKIEFNNIKGEKEHVTESEIFQHFLRLPYSTDLVQESIIQLKKTKDPIGNVFKFLESICLRLDSKSKNAIKSEPKKSAVDNIPKDNSPGITWEELERKRRNQKE